MLIQDLIKALNFCIRFKITMDNNFFFGCLRLQKNIISLLPLIKTKWRWMWKKMVYINFRLEICKTKKSNYNREKRFFRCLKLQKGWKIIIFLPLNEKKMKVTVYLKIDVTSMYILNWKFVKLIKKKIKKHPNYREPFFFRNMKLQIKRNMIVLYLELKSLIVKEK